MVPANDADIKVVFFFAFSGTRKSEYASSKSRLSSPYAKNIHNCSLTDCQIQAIFVGLF